MTVRREIAQSHARRARGAGNSRGVLEQYVERVSGEPARQGHVAAALARSSAINMILARRRNSIVDDVDLSSIAAETFMNNAG
jgi:hypothetical protein